MKWLLVLLLVMLAACASATPEGAKVRYTANPQATVGCKFLGNVKGTSKTQLQNEAGKIGANVVFNSETTPAAWFQHGEAYSCKDQNIR